MTSHQILFLDIETAPEEELLINISEHGQRAFKKKFQHVFDAMPSKYIGSNGTDINDIPVETRWQHIYEKEVSFLAEYSRVICVCIGYISMKENTELFRIKEIYGPEDNILLEVAKLMEFNNGSIKFEFICAHNGKQFDFPFLNRRFLAHGFQIPRLLNGMFKKPWEVSQLDTKEMWSFTNLKHNASLDTICYCLGVSSPKGSIDGSQVATVFRAGGIKEIAKYCSGDTVALVNVFRAMIGEKLLEEYQVITVE